MSLGVTLNTNRNYIDISSVNEVAKQIFTKTEAKSFDINTADLSKFRRPEVGIDLYSQRTNLDTTKQIAIRNAGLDIKLNENFVANIQYLNSVAAQNVNKVAKNVEGKIIAPVAEGEKSEVKNIFNLPGTIELTSSKNLDKDKRGSNPFSMAAPANTQEVDNAETKELNMMI